MTFLKIVGGFFVALVLFVLVVVVLGFLWLRMKFRGFIAKAAEAAAEAARMGRFMPPMRLKLEPTADLQWDHAEEVEALAAPLREAGFVPAGDYLAVAIVPLKIRALVHPGESVYAVIYETEPIGVWLDLVTRYTDDTSVTYATAKPSGMKRQPGHLLQNMPGAGAKEVLERFLAERPQKERLPATAELFVSRFEKAYAEDMDWMAERGGPSEEEIRAVAGADGSEVTDEMVHMIQEGWRRHFNEFRAEQLREKFLATSQVPAAEWEEIRDRLVFIHDQLSPAELLGFLGVAPEEEEGTEEDEEDLDDEEKAARARDKELLRIAASCPPREAFARMNEVLPKDEQFRRRGQLNEPLPADVWAGPSDEDD